MIHIAIVEDEKEYMDQLKEYLLQYENEFEEPLQITEYSDGDGILQKYKGQFDLILMDIEMPFADGMTTAEYIRKTDQGVIIIFITNMAQYAIRGYAVDALDYVLKPVSYFAFSQRIKRAVTRMKKRTDKFITIHSKNSVNKIRVSDITWIESIGHRLIYNTLYNHYESTVSTMKELEGRLKDDNFFRCNKCYLVNLAHVKGIEDGYAIMGKSKVLISRSRKAEFQKALTEYAGEVIK